MYNQFILFKSLTVFSDGSVVLFSNVNNKDIKLIKNVNKDLKSFQCMNKSNSSKTLTNFHDKSFINSFRKNLFK